MRKTRSPAAISGASVAGMAAEASTATNETSIGLEAAQVGFDLGLPEVLHFFFEVGRGPEQNCEFPARLAHPHDRLDPLIGFEGQRLGDVVYAARTPLHRQIVLPVRGHATEYIIDPRRRWVVTIGRCHAPRSDKRA